MRLLLDTHVLISMVDERFGIDFPVVRDLLLERAATGFASVASLWEIAIKSRLWKLHTAVPLLQIPDFLASSGISILPINIDHVMAVTVPEPPTRDPFDRLLLAQCMVEGFRLVTIDRALVGHPLASSLRSWRVL